MENGFSRERNRLGGRCKSTVILNRNIPICPKKPVLPERDNNRFYKKLNVVAITPILGAGVEPGYSDFHFPIRGSTLRGLLRYWWRACNFQTDDLKVLRKRETEIFGSTNVASDLRLKVLNVQCATSTKNQPTMPRYATFSCRKDKEADNSQNIESFTFAIECNKSYEKEIEEALWAWANFGGIGMRTRRGAGSIYIEEYAPTDVKELEDRLTNVIKCDKRTSWSRLSSKMLCGNRQKCAMSVWNDIIKVLEDFTQKDVGRNKDKGRFKRSRWPEADSIRRITKSGSSKHAQSITGEENAFPRALFGLPIIIDLRGEHVKATISPIGGERYPSPLILKPLALKGKNEFIPLVFVMNAPELKGVSVEGQEFSLEHIKGEKVISYQKSPIRNQGKANAIDAFEAYVKASWEKS